MRGLWFSLVLVCCEFEFKGCEDGFVDLLDEILEVGLLYEMFVDFGGKYYGDDIG